MVDEIQTYFKHDIPGGRQCLKSGLCAPLGSARSSRCTLLAGRAMVPAGAALPALIDAPPPHPPTHSLTHPPLPAEVPFDDEDKFVEVLKKAGLTEG